MENREKIEKLASGGLLKVLDLVFIPGSIIRQLKYMEKSGIAVSKEDHLKFAGLEALRIGGYVSPFIAMYILAV